MLAEAAAPAVSFMQVAPHLCPALSMNIKKRRIRKLASPVGLEPETIRLTAERANQSATLTSQDLPMISTIRGLLIKSPLHPGSFSFDQGFE